MNVRSVDDAVREERQRCAAIARAVLKRETAPVQRRIAREIARLIEGKTYNGRMSRGIR